jgi:hypothetical protein
MASLNRDRVQHALNELLVVKDRKIPLHDLLTKSTGVKGPCLSAIRAVFAFVLHEENHLMHSRIL